ncbi:uncharacterized protein [Centruroides vittatus]|uniref:uncharacterized protein isoform X2 n=1 Tax=Centruroides vittatus TaxID=120091 RepID=UPI00350F3DB9
METDTEWNARYKGFAENHFMKPRIRNPIDFQASSLKTIRLPPPEPVEKVFVHQLNLTSGDVRKREKEKKMVEEEKEKLKSQREILQRQKEEEKKRDMEMLRSFNPWGKPGAGAPPDDPKRKKHFMETEVPETEDSILKFGQPGAGAPNRTKSGKVKTQIAGDVDIRFQPAQAVKLSIENQLRYKNTDKENYRNELDNLIQSKQSIKEQEIEWNKQKQEEMEKFYPFGRSKENDPIFLPTNPFQKNEQTNDPFNPWGKGFGNPERDGKGNVLRHPTVRSKDVGIPDPPAPPEDLGLVLPISENKGGNGYPHRTKSGNIKTRLKKTLDRADQSGNVISENIEGNGEIYNPFGKPGAGAPFSREAGKNFMEKMGWTSSDPKDFNKKDAKLEYLNTLQKEIEEKKNRDKQERIQIREPTTEFVDVLKTKEVGKPKKDPITGEMKRNPRIVSDVTSHKLDIRRAKTEESSEYNNFLRQQTEEKQKMLQQAKTKEQEEIMQHQDKWDSFWGKPGNGAPLQQQQHKKENLSSLLHNPQGTTEPYVKRYTMEIVPSKHKNFYELSTKDANNVIKKEYEFKTPWPAMT